jgi:exo-1,4-beta-D-glucosaminidase
MYLKRFIALGIAIVMEITEVQTIAVKPGTEEVFSSWSIQSSAFAGENLAALSVPGVDTEGWKHVNVSRCTLMACLIAANEYDEEELFFSDNLKRVDKAQFAIPWLYRNEFQLEVSPGQNYFLQTNGISSKADIFVNGEQVADSSVQSGSYTGLVYDISKLISQRNALVIRVYPTDYNYDFAVGFVDWNPYPPDNGTGVWRDVSIKQTGPIALGPLRIATDLGVPLGSSATVSLKAVVRNLNNERTDVVIRGSVLREGLDTSVSMNESITIGPMATTEVALKVELKNPDLWWPKRWGSQHLYKANITAELNGVVSDTSEEKTFGLRKVTSHINSHDDVQFYVNDQPFQVAGGGYSADMFLRWDGNKFRSQVQYMLDIGLNSVRLEGKMEQPELYEIADRLGLMIIAGWECCDKWEAWSYNPDLAVQPVPLWDDNDYTTANMSMLHETLMLQNHPSILAFLIGSDYWPNDRATSIYLDALGSADWQAPIIASASKRGFPSELGSSGMKMSGPYDWVPPSYWFDTEPSSNRFGAAFGFGSELGAGVGTPELGSLKKFLTKSDMDDLWKEPEKGLFHMSRDISVFYNRGIYNKALWSRYGPPSSLEDYINKAQMMDYEAIRAEFEAYSAMWNADRPATGLIYWMLNNAWPSLHWNQFDYYLHPAGSYFGTKTACRVEHVAYDYLRGTVWLINRSLNTKGNRKVSAEVLGVGGKLLSSTTYTAETLPNHSFSIGQIALPEDIQDVVFLRLILSDEIGKVLSRNVYWLSNVMDTLDWSKSDWYYTPTSKFADFTSLNSLQTAYVSTNITARPSGNSWSVVLENTSPVPAVFVRLELVTKDGESINPVIWSDNYITLWPLERIVLEVDGDDKSSRIQISGMNVAKADVSV